ncbi:unnamed protein product [Rotaria magnacalcarata]
MSFIRPDNKVIAEALGDINTLPSNMQMAVKHKVDESFQPVPTPRSGDWLRQHQEKGQTLKSFERTMSKAIPHATFKTIYIQPVGSFNHLRAAPLDVITEFSRVFFAGCEVEVLPAIDFTNTETRDKRDKRRELLCVAVTMADIYPDDKWNFVYGQASPLDGFGVYSFARLDPLFFKSSNKLNNTPLTDEHRIIIRRRCVKILLHEVGHLFGLKHCIYYVCLMNGANHEIEMDRQPLYLCPVCLRKLHSTLQFDVKQMYENFVNLCEKYELEEETIWYRRRLELIQEKDT